MGEKIGLAIAILMNLIVLAGIGYLIYEWKFRALHEHIKKIRREKKDETTRL